MLFIDQSLVYIDKRLHMRSRDGSNPVRDFRDPFERQNLLITRCRQEGGSDESTQTCKGYAWSSLVQRLTAGERTPSSRWSSSMGCNNDDWSDLIYYHDVRFIQFHGGGFKGEIHDKERKTQLRLCIVSARRKSLTTFQWTRIKGD